jgi:hypothetical protein
MAATATQGHIEGYDGMSVPTLCSELRLHSQAELTEVDAYERSHEDRTPVLDKLRYLRTREPVSGYDDLSTEDLLTRLGDVDAGTLLAARGYETKLRHRPEVLDGIDTLRTAGRPKAPEPADGGPGSYQGSLASRLVLNIGAGGLIVVAAVMFVISVFVTAIVVLAAVAPNALS